MISSVIAFYATGTANWGMAGALGLFLLVRDDCALHRLWRGSRARRWCRHERRVRLGGAAFNALRFAFGVARRRLPAAAARRDPAARLHLQRLPHLSDQPPLAALVRASCATARCLAPGDRQQADHRHGRDAARDGARHAGGARACASASAVFRGTAALALPAADGGAGGGARRRHADPLRRLGPGDSYPGVIIAHTVLCVPFVVVNVSGLACRIDPARGTRRAESRRLARQGLPARDACRSPCRACCPVPCLPSPPRSTRS